METGEDGRSSPRAVVNRLISFAEEYQIGEDDQLWAVLDTDHWILGNSKAGLMEAIGEARQKGYRIAMSNPCFDLWLLLHHEPVSPGTLFENCKAVGARIRAVVGEFNKTNLKPAHYPAANVLLAITRAKSLESDRNFDGGTADYWPEVTGTRIFLLIEHLQAAGLFPPK